MYKHLNSNKGSAFVFVLLVTTVLVIFGLSILSTAIADTKLTSYQENSIKAYYLAQSGAQTLADYIIKTQDADEINAMVEARQSQPIQISDGFIVLDVSRAGNELIIRSTGTVNGVSQTASVALEKSEAGGGDFLSDFSIFSVGEIEIMPNAKIRGTIGTTSSRGDGNKVKGDVDEIKYDMDIELPPIKMPYIEEKNTIHQINKTWQHETSGEEYIHIENGVFLGKDEKIRITGSGVLHLYVSGQWECSKFSEIIAEPGVTLIIYIMDAPNVIFASHEFNGIIYAPNSTFDNKNADKGRYLIGSIIAKQVKITNHTTVIHDKHIDFGKLTIDSGNFQIKEWR